MRSLFRHRPILLALVTGALLACSADLPIVPPVSVAAVQVSPTPLTLAAGQAQSLVALVSAADGTPLSDRTVTWSSTNRTVATVSLHGVVTAIAEGSAVVRAVSEGKVGEAIVTVLAGTPPAGEVVQVELNFSGVGLEEGLTQQLVATPRDGNGNPMEHLTVQWSSSDLHVATVSSTGLVTAIRSGTATITARVQGRFATAAISVTANYDYNLLYSGYDEAAMELFEVDLRTGARSRPLPPNTWAGGARPSPDGSRIAFTGQVNGVHGLYVADRNGDNVRLLAGNDIGPSISPTWSPDGSKIAYAVLTDPGHDDIWVMNADGTNKVNLTSGMGNSDQIQPAWGPAGPDGASLIAFVHRANGVERIWTMRPDGSDKRQVTTGVLDTEPAFSPDGGTIVYARSTSLLNGDIWLAKATGGDERPLFPSHPLAGPQMNPTVSPDGRLIAFASQHETWGTGSGNTQIYTVWIDGSKVVRRTSANGYMPAFISR